MAISKSLHNFTSMEALNSETAIDWSESSRGQTHNNTGESGTRLEVEFTLTSSHTILYILCENKCSVGFYSDSGENNGNNSLRVDSGKVHKFLIPNGANYFVVTGIQVEDANRYCYMVTG